MQPLSGHNLRGAFAFQQSGLTTLGKAGASVRDPAHLLIRARSLRLNSIGFVLITVGTRRLWREAALRSGGVA